MQLAAASALLLTGSAVGAVRPFGYRSFVGEQPNRDINTTERTIFTHALASSSDVGMLVSQSIECRPFCGFSDRLLAISDILVDRDGKLGAGPLHRGQHDPALLRGR